MVKNPGDKKPGKKLGGAVMSLFLDKRARAAYQAAKNQDAAQRPTSPAPAPAHGPAPGPHGAAQTPHPTPEEINARLDEAVEQRARRAGTPDRQALIQDALRIHADKSKMLDDLPDEQKQKLKAMAMMALVKPGQGN